MDPLEARVIKVRQRDLEEDFAVTAGEPPDLWWFTTRTPPRLGSLLRFRGQVVETRELPQVATVRVLDHHDLEVEVVPEPWARRQVAAAWVERAKVAVRLPLYAFQAEGAGWAASRLSRNKGAIISDDPGLGKTVQAISAVMVLEALQPGAGLPSLVVCPATVKDNWCREIVQNASVTARVFDPGKPIPDTSFVVTNYEALPRHERALTLHGFRTLVFDEAHIIKNPKTGQRHRAAVATRLARTIRRVLLLSGSPVPNHPTELWRLLHVADPEEWPSFEHFRERYCTAPTPEELAAGARKAIVTSVGTLSNPAELHARASDSWLRRQKAHVLHELPSKSRRVIRVQLPERDASNYRKAEIDVIKWLREVGAQALGPRRKETFLRLASLRKIAAIGKLRSAFPSFCASWRDRAHKPLVVFCYHRPIAKGTLRILRALGLRAAALTADQSWTARQQVIDAFNEGTIDYLVCPLLIAGVGLNLQARCQDVLFLERLWTPKLMEQAEDRVHRIGQKHDVSCVYMDAAGTIDDHMARVLASKSRLIDHAVGDVLEEMKK